MIHKLESAGLGYHVATQETHDRLGKTKASTAVVSIPFAAYFKM